MAELLHELVTLSAAALSVHSRLLCGVTMVRKKKPATVATSHPRVRAMDELQYSYGDGPCLTALRDLETIYIPSLQDESRWPHYCQTAWSEGIRSILALESRTVIDLATGIIMAQNQCNQDTAIKVLRSASNTRNRKLRDVAALLVASVGRDPDVITHFD